MKTSQCNMTVYRPLKTVRICAGGKGRTFFEEGIELLIAWRWRLARSQFMSNRISVP